MKKQYPEYTCHKTVRAFLIAAILPAAAGGAHLQPPVESLLPAIEVSGDYMQKHRPVVGGYFVQYEDGYQSFSPAQAFEAGYTLVEAPPAVEGDAPPEEAQKPAEQPVA
jgi:hypothetical protein